MLYLKIKSIIRHRGKMSRYQLRDPTRTREKRSTLIHILNADISGFIRHQHFYLRYRDVTQVKVQRRRGATIVHVLVVARIFPLSWRQRRRCARWGREKGVR